MYGDALTTISRVKDRLDITTTTHDEFFTNLILSVTARIQQMTGRRFIQATYSNELHDGGDGFGSRRIFLIPKNAPLQNVASIQYKLGLNSSPNWTTIPSDDYDVDLQGGIIRLHYPLPDGFQNIRITYTGGFSGYSFGIANFWFFNVTPTGAVNGTNATFTLPEAADQVIVYADGVRLAASNVNFTAGGTSFTILNNLQPFTTIAVDYKRSVASNDGDYNLPADLVDVCERAVVHLFKKRQSEGRESETFSESSINWQKEVFRAEDLATIKNYRRGYNL